MLRVSLARLISLFVGVCFLPSMARAQGVRIFALGSGSYLFNEKFFVVDGDRFRSDYAPGGRITFGGEYTPWKILGIEGAYAFGRNNLRVTDLESTPAQEIGYGIRDQRLNGNLVLHSPVKLLGLRPYATAGLEYMRFSPTSEAKTLAFMQGFANRVAVLESSNKWGFNAGGGVEWSILPALALRLDLRNHSVGTPRYGLPQTSATRAIFPVSGSAQNLEVSLGISFHIGD